jgi:hypothetical protein
MSALVGRSPRQAALVEARRVLRASARLLEPRLSPADEKILLDHTMRLYVLSSDALGESEDS